MGDKTENTRWLVFRRITSFNFSYDNDEGTWDELAERRLFKKILEHKPAGTDLCDHLLNIESGIKSSPVMSFHSGPLKHYHLAMLHKLMNNVYEDEDTDFEDLLTPSEFLGLF